MSKAQAGQVPLPLHSPRERAECDRMPHAPCGPADDLPTAHFLYYFGLRDFYSELYTQWNFTQTTLCNETNSQVTPFTIGAFCPSAANILGVQYPYMERLRVSWCLAAAFAYNWCSIRGQAQHHLLARLAVQTDLAPLPRVPAAGQPVVPRQNLSLHPRGHQPAVPTPRASPDAHDSLGWVALGPHASTCAAPAAPRAMCSDRHSRGPSSAVARIAP